MNHNKIFLGSSIFLLGVFIMSAIFISFNEIVLNQASAILLNSPIIHMSDTTQSSGRSTYADRQIHAEYVSPSSQLVGDSIDSITLKLKRTYNPTGIATIGIFNENLSVKKSFGTVDSAKLPSTYSEITFSLPAGETYQIKSGDYIGIKFTGGDTKNHISTMVDANTADPFDGANSYHVYYTNSWKAFVSNDLYMILKQSNSSTTPQSDTTAPITQASPPGGTYSSSQSVALSANEPSVIYYTTNGSTPSTSSAVYSSSIPVSSSATLKFFAVDTSGNKESVNTKTYTITTDTTAPITQASPPGGTYSSSQSVALSANEPSVIYYTTNGSTPSTSSAVYSAPISVTSSATLKFFAVDNAGNKESIKTEIYTIGSSVNDIFGIKKIYPSKTNGNSWFMNMENPTSDPRFDPKATITKNSDGSWKIKSNQVRMNVYSSDKYTYQNTPIPTFSRNDLANTGYMQLPSDWKNFEMTGYVKLNVASTDEFTWYGRGGKHNDNNNGCEGSAYKAQLLFAGGSRFAKESWHVHYDFTSKKYNTPSLLDKWVGFKFVVYNQPGINFDQKVQMEIWVDLQNNNNWVKVDSFTDDGWGSGATHCGPASSDKMPISWGGPEITYRADNAPDFDFKYLSVREITP